jgi:hypothetical protein
MPPIDSTTTAILVHLRAMGYAVSVHRMQGGISLSGERLPVPDVYVEMHAVIGDPPDVHVARVEGEGDDVEYRCAAELAMLVGIDLEG